MSDVNPTALALSDLLVLTALERAWARTVKRGRYAVNAAQRHNQYIHTPVSEDRMEAILRDAWALCPLLAHRHALDLDPVAWSDTLDNYTRALLMMCQPHSPDRIAPHIERLLGAAPAQSDTDTWGTAHG